VKIFIGGTYEIVNFSIQQRCDKCPVGYNWTISKNSSASKGGFFNGAQNSDDFFVQLNTTAIGTWAVLEKLSYISASSFSRNNGPDILFSFVLTMMSLF
jgi:hypothetical protein